MSHSESISAPPPPKQPFVIGVAGGTASGKTSVCHKIIELLGQSTVERVALISQDSFYKDLSEEEREVAGRGEYNFDHPGLSAHRSFH